MKELSLHILDIGQNSISAEATLVEITVDEQRIQDWLVIRIADNGRGMDADTAVKVVDPFYTSRTTRKVGLGIPMFKANAEQCGGRFTLNTQPGVGTEVTAAFQFSHIDRVPLGDMPDTIMAMVMANPSGDLVYEHRIDERSFHMDTRELREILGDVPLDTTEVLLWVREHVREGLEEIESE